MSWQYFDWKILESDKKKYTYLSPDNNGKDLYHGINKFIKNYNRSRPHQSIDNKKLKNVYNMFHQKVA